MMLLNAAAITSVLLLPSVFAKVRIFVLIGESNMRGRGSYANLHHMAETNEEYEYLLDDTNSFASRSDVRLVFNEADFQSAVDLTVGYGLLNETFGPEVGFGKVVGDFYDDPVLLVKCATGGTRLGVEWRSPTASQRDYSGAGVGDPDEYGFMWRTMVDMIDTVTMNLDAYVPGYADGDIYDIEGIVWMQGWNDAFHDGMRNDYEENLTSFVDDLTLKYGKKVKIVIVALGQLGMNMGDYWFESQILGPIMQAQEAVANANSPQVLFLPTARYAQPVDPLDPYVPADGEKFDGLHHYFGRAATIINIGYGAATAIVEAIETDAPSSAPTLKPTKKPTRKQTKAPSPLPTMKTSTRPPTRKAKRPRTSDFWA